jgi:hypothetical protein
MTLADLPGIACPLESLRVDHGGLHVQGDVNPDRARTTSHSETHGRFEMGSYLGGFPDRDGVLGDRSDERADIDFLWPELTHVWPRLEICSFHLS